MNNKKSLSPKRVPCGLLLLVPILFLSLPVASQQKDEIPDGTTGEVLGVKDSTTSKKEVDYYTKYNSPFSTFKFGLGFLYEYAGFSQNAIGSQQSDSLGGLKGGFKTRDFRVLASGKFNTKRLFTWKIGIMYDGVNDEWFWRESGFLIGVPELAGTIFIGRTKEGFSLNKVMNGYAGWTMERQMALDPIPILADGIKWLGFLPKKRILWNIGMFTDWTSKNQSFSTYKWQFIARVGWLPIYSEESKTLLHIAANIRFGDPEDGAIRLRSRPESNIAPYFIDTGTFNAEHSNHLGGEIYYSNGPWMLGTEYYWYRFKSAEKNDPVFNGGDAVVSYIFGGGSRPYSTTNSIYGFVPVTKSIFKGGAGTWEALVRYSYFNLNDQTITGGKFWRITPMINWYMSKNLRLEFAYGYGILDRFQLKGATTFFQTRVQFVIL